MFFSPVCAIIFTFPFISVSIAASLPFKVVNQETHIQEYYLHVQYALAHITLCPTKTK